MTDNDLSKIEELVLCGVCKRPFNDSNLLPKFLYCKHTFCLECIQSGFSKGNVQKGSTIRSGELYCDLCWKLTELSDKGAQALDTNVPTLALVHLYTKLKGDSTTVTNGGDVPYENPPHLENEANSVDVCAAHGLPLSLWCIDCERPICKDCQKSLHLEPQHHKIWTLQQAKEQMVKEAYIELSCMSRMDDNVRQLARRQRQFLVLIRDACTALIGEVQSSLDSDWNVDPTVEIREALSQIQLALMDAKSPKEVHQLYSALLLKKQNLQAKCQEMIIQCQLNDLIGHSEVIFNFDSLRQSVASILSNDNEIRPLPLQQPLHDPILFLTNYCMSQLFSRLHQRPNGDGFLLNPNMQRQLAISPGEIPANQSTPVIPTPPQNFAPEPAQNFSDAAAHNFPPAPSQNFPPTLPQNFPLTENSEIFINSNEISQLSQVDYAPQLRAVSPQVNQASSRPPSPPKAISPPPVTVAPNLTLQATTAQIVQMHSAVPVDRPEQPSPIIHPPLRPVPTRSPANVYPRYFFNIDISGGPKGKIVIETRPDVAPKMCRNFDRLTTADRRMSYKGCNFFQCWKNESVITGDYEFNTGRGGRSIYDDGYFQPDETRLPAVRGAVGMRRQQKKHDHFGLVGSQFRIILQEMQGFTGIFGHVIEGIELIEHIASFGDVTGKPAKTITIAKCGKLP